MTTPLVPRPLTMEPKREAVIRDTARAVEWKYAEGGAEHDDGVAFKHLGGHELLDELDATREALAQVTQERDEAKALAKVGTWHEDCRPNREQAGRELLKSQQIIDKLADEISALQADAPRLSDLAVSVAKVEAFCAFVLKADHRDGSQTTASNVLALLAPPEGDN